jgi:hypothetical protein
MLGCISFLFDENEVFLLNVSVLFTPLPLHHVFTLLHTPKSFHDKGLQPIFVYYPRPTNNLLCPRIPLNNQGFKKNIRFLKKQLTFVY